MRGILRFVFSINRQGTNCGFTRALMIKRNDDDDKKKFITFSVLLKTYMQNFVLIDRVNIRRESVTNYQIHFRIKKNNIVRI